MSSDILQNFAECLHSAGLEAESIIADGLLHRCGTHERPRRKDGAYKAYLDDPPCIWWLNWRTGESGTWTAASEKSLTAKERKELRERIDKAKADTQEERERRWQAGARLAALVWGNSHPANAGHPYLKEKAIPAAALRQTKDNRLIVPILNEAGKIQSLQFILPEKLENGINKLFLKGGKTGGGYCPLAAKDGKKDGPLLIAEGFATAASLRLATGYAVLAAFSAGNLLPVAQMARRKYRDREIIICADNDIATKDNPGVAKATMAARAINGKLAICPICNDKPSDFNDLYRLKSAEAVNAAIEEARKQNVDCPMPEGFFIIPEGKRAGLYKMDVKPDGEMMETRIGPPLHVNGMTRDAEGNEWGLMLEWADPDNTKHLWAMPIDLLFRQNSEWFSILASGGWLGNPLARKKLVEFFSSVRPVKRIRCVPHIGWDADAYILPEAAYGSTGNENVVLQAYNQACLYRCSGSFESWKEIGRLAVGNSRLSFALCAAFAGPLLRLAGMEGGGFSFEGGSSSGKTTALQIAASVWGSPDHVRSWRATDNGLEAIAAMHNDNVLILDEVGQVNGKVLAECAYMLANGQGKGRSTREGSLRKLHTWRLLFLSSGELGLADKVAENGIKSRGGQEVRFVGLPVDASMLTDLHGYANAGAVANRLKELSAAHYGYAGRAFLEKLVLPENLATIRQEVNEVIAKRVNLLVSDEADGQVRRVARRFALCCLAGSLAMNFGILPPEFDAVGCVETCFNAWITQRGGIGASEDAAILATVRLFIEQHGMSRFQDMDRCVDTCVNRVGFRREAHGVTEYIILPESFRTEVVRGYSPRRAGAVLRNAGWLRQSDGKSTTKRELPGLGRIRVYVLVLPDEPDEEKTGDENISASAYF